MVIYLVYLTYCKICDRLYWYKDTDLASLTYDVSYLYTDDRHIVYILHWQRYSHVKS